MDHLMVRVTAIFLTKENFCLTARKQYIAESSYKGVMLDLL